MTLHATNRFPGDGVTTQYEFNFTGGYLDRSHVRAAIEDADGNRTPVTLTAANWLNDYTLKDLPPVPVGSTMVIYRETPAMYMVDYTNGTRITETALDITARQGLFKAVEAEDRAGGGGGGGGGGPVNWDDVQGKPYASSTVPGIIKVGANLSIDSQGRLNAAGGGGGVTPHTHSLSDLQQSGASFGQVPTWDGTKWVPATPESADCPCEDSGGPVSNKLRIVVLGDSESATQPTLSEAWPTFLQDLLNSAGAEVEVINLAINGYTFYQANTSAAFGSQTMVQKAVSLNPNVVLVALGFNDTVMGVGGRTLAQVQSDASTLFSTLRSSLPSATLCHLAEIAYDDVNYTGSGTLRNKFMLPALWDLATSGILQNAYCVEALENVISSGKQAGINNLRALNTHVAGLSTVSTTATLHLWRAARLGCCGADGLHLTESGHRLLAGSVRSAFSSNPVLAAAIPGLSDQGYAAFRDPFFGTGSVFDLLLASSGTGYVERVPPTNSGQHVLTQYGPWVRFPVNVWFMPSKGAIKWNRTNLSQTETFLWSITGGPSLTTVQASINGGAWFNVGATDQRGDFADAGPFTTAVAPGSYVYRYRIGNEVYGPITVTLTASGSTSVSWGDVTGKPFNSVGNGLTVSGGVLSVSNPVPFNTVGTGLTVSAGVLSVSNPVPFARAGGGFGMCTNTPGAANNWKLISWSAATVGWGDVVPRATSNDIYITSTGQYLIQASVMFDKAGATAYPSGTIAMIAIRIWRSGTPIFRQQGTTFYAPGAGYAGLGTVTALMGLNAGDTVTIEGFTTSNDMAFVATSPHGNTSNFSVIRV